MEGSGRWKKAADGNIRWQKAEQGGRRYYNGTEGSGMGQKVARGGRRSAFAEGFSLFCVNSR